MPFGRRVAGLLVRLVLLCLTFLVLMTVARATDFLSGSPTALRVGRPPFLAAPGETVGRSRTTDPAVIAMTASMML